MLKHPTSSQAEVEATPNIEQIEVADSPDESPAVAELEAISGQASTRALKHRKQQLRLFQVHRKNHLWALMLVSQSTPLLPVPMGRMDAFTGSIGQWSNPLMYSAMPGEETTPQATSSEAASSQETQEGSSNPPQGEGGCIHNISGCTS